MDSKMNKDFHSNDFKSSTITKLELFRKYLQEWLPVFIRPNAIWPTINIFDLFAGPGTDPSGTIGSPLIILEELQRFQHVIKSENLDIQIFFNDNDQEKIDNLEKSVQSF
jgi:three-Cys-motif partner protein